MAQPHDPAAEAGDRQPAADLLPLLYNELRAIAAGRLAHEAPGQTLQPTALVHEAYLRLVGPGDRPQWADHSQFLAAAAEAMRRILIEAARRKGRVKRGGGRDRLPIDPDELAEVEVEAELLDLDEALTAFAAAEPTIAELVKLRYFGGLTLKEAAAALGIPIRTANSHWAYARAWLLAEMARGQSAK